MRPKARMTVERSTNRRKWVGCGGVKERLVHLTVYCVFEISVCRWKETCICSALECRFNSICLKYLRTDSVDRLQWIAS